MINTFVNCSFYCRQNQSIKNVKLYLNSGISGSSYLFCFFLNQICSSSLLSARLKAFKMSLDQVPVVTKLLRASRSCNEMLLKDCFKEILECGISIKDLNATDKSGRVSRIIMFHEYFLVIL